MASNTDGRSSNSFSLWRIIFTAVIMIFHFVGGTQFYSIYPNIKYHWYIAVEFFFVLSGYLLMLHIEKNPAETAPAYGLSRVRRLYPEYIVAFLIMAGIKACNSGLNILKVIIPNWMEALMLQSIWTNIFPYVNNPAWYVSALLIMSFLIYYLLKEHRNLYLQFIGPLGVIGAMSYMYRQYGGLENFYHTEGLLLNTALLRAFTGLTLGVYVYLASEGLRKNYKSSGKGFKVCVSLLQILIFAGCLGFAMLNEDQNYDFLFLALMAAGLLLASVDEGLGRLSGLWVIKQLDRFSYAMYLSHFAAIFVMSLLFDTWNVWAWWYLPVYYLITLLLGILYSLIAGGLTGLACKCKNKLSSPKAE